MYKIKFRTHDDFYKAVDILDNLKIYLFSANKKRKYLTIAEADKAILIKMVELGGRIIEDYRYEAEASSPTIEEMQRKYFPKETIKDGDVIDEDGKVIGKQG